MRRKHWELAICAITLAARAHAGAPQFQLRDTNGTVHTAGEWSGHKAVLLFFVTTDCPIGNSYVPEMNRIRDAYSARGVAVYGVQADPTVPEAAVARYAKEYRYGFPLLIDAKQALVRYAGATVTPQAVILSADGKILYLGRIDNRMADFGKQRLQATVLDLREALDAILAGKPVAQPVTKSIGCAINRIAAGVK